MKRRAKIICGLACLGLFGPFLGYFLYRLNADELAPIVRFFWPTWLIGWFAVGRFEDTSSEAAGILIVAASVMANVIVFAVLGWIVSRLSFKNRVATLAVSVLIYGALYGVVTFGIMQFL